MKWHVDQDRETKKRKLEQPGLKRERKITEKNERNMGISKCNQHLNLVFLGLFANNNNIYTKKEKMNNL